ncbi:unnamed protein product [Closterium sp. NIES-65]|nr:unnamed protein product [Closterium sp. NIES-65]
MFAEQPRLSPHIVLSLDASPPSRPPCPRRHHHSQRFLAQARGILFPPRARSFRLPRGILLPPRARICCLSGGLLSPSLACGTRLYSARVCCLPAWPPLSIPCVLLDNSPSREPLAFIARAINCAPMRGLLSPSRSSSSRRPTRASLASPHVHLSPPRACISRLPARASLASPRVLLPPPRAHPSGPPAQHPLTMRTCDTRLPSRAPLSSPPMHAPLPSPRMLLSPHLPTCATLCSPCVRLSPPRTCFPLLTLRAPLASPRVLPSPPRACSPLLPARTPLTSPCELLSPDLACSSALLFPLSPSFSALLLFRSLLLFPPSASLVDLHSSLPPRSLPSHSTASPRVLLSPL